MNYLKISYLSVRKCYSLFGCTNPLKTKIKYNLYVWCFFIINLTSFFFCLALLLAGGLLQQQLSLQSPEFVSQVRGLEECPAMCLTSVKLREEHVVFTGLSGSIFLLPPFFYILIILSYSLPAFPSSRPLLMNWRTWQLSLFSPSVSRFNFVVQTILSSSSLTLFKHKWTGGSDKHSCTYRLTPTHSKGY